MSYHSRLTQIDSLLYWEHWREDRKMKLRYNVRKNQWEACWVQAGSPSGWSAWDEYDRLDALNRIERGFSFEYYEGF